MLQIATSGGETLLADGFHAVHNLRQSNESAYKCLRDMPIPHEYRDTDKHHLYTNMPVIIADGNDNVIQVSAHTRIIILTIPP